MAGRRRSGYRYEPRRVASRQNGTEHVHHHGNGEQHTGYHRHDTVRGHSDHKSHGEHFVKPNETVNTADQIADKSISFEYPLNVHEHHKGHGHHGGHGHSEVDDHDNDFITKMNTTYVAGGDFENFANLSTHLGSMHKDHVGHVHDMNHGHVDQMHSVHHDHSYYGTITHMHEHHMIKHNMDGHNMDEHHMRGHHVGEHHMGGHHMGGHHGMTMYFHTNTNFAFLLEGINISSTEGIVLAMAFTLILTVLFEALNFNIHLRERHLVHLVKTKKSKARRLWHLFLTSLFKCLSTALAYIVMLSAMTMNIWLIVAVTAGSGIGHLLVRPLLAALLAGQYENDNIEAIKETIEIDEAKLPLSAENDDQNTPTSCCQKSDDAMVDAQSQNGEDEIVALRNSYI